MADQSDVETALVGLSAAALYPRGPAGESIAGVDCRVYRGWPSAAALDNDLSIGLVNVTVYPAEGTGRVTTRYVQQWVGSPVNPSLSVQVSGTSVTFAGTIAVGQVAGILVDGQSYAYRIQGGDTPAAVASNLAVLVRSNQIALLSGTTVTIPGAGNLLARVVADAPVQREVRRQAQTFRVSCWCPTPSTRDVVATAIDQAMAVLTFIDLADGTQGRLTYSGTTVFDRAQDALLYRRDLLYEVEYATIVAASDPSMLFGDLQLNAANFIV